MEKTNKKVFCKSNQFSTFLFGTFLSYISDTLEYKLFLEGVLY